MGGYVHGYAPAETDRLHDQATTLVDLLHADTCFTAGDHVLEVGCGVGAQTLWLAQRNPAVHITAIDACEASLRQAEARVQQANIGNVTFRHLDLHQLQPQGQPFDHVFLSFVLEHLPDPIDALKHLHDCLRRQGRLTVVEGDHGSFYCHPESQAAEQVVRCLVDLQALAGGNALIGRQLYPLLSQAGYGDPEVSARTVYVDASRPDLVDGFSKRTFIAMIEGVRDQALAAGLIDEAAWQKGIKDLYRATEPDGTFCYTFFKAHASKAG